MKSEESSGTGRDLVNHLPCFLLLLSSGEKRKKLKNPIILVVTDRIDLDDQISKTFRNCNFPNPIQIRETRGTHRKLYELLSQKVGNTILTTVHLFRKPLDKPLSEAENIIVLTDEAHRTQYGFFALNMRRALPNASFFAFTGTPLDKRDETLTVISALLESGIWMPIRFAMQRMIMRLYRSNMQAD